LPIICTVCDKEDSGSVFRAPLTMASLICSWIFIVSLITPGLAQVNEVLAQRAVTNHHGLTQAEKSRNTFIALAIAFTVVFVAVIVGVLALVFRAKNKFADAESGPVSAGQAEKPHWFMVNSGKKWWPSNLGLTPKEQAEHPDGTRVERLKLALNKMAARSGKPLLPMHNKEKSPDLPIQQIPGVSPRYPDILERTAQIPSIIVEKPNPRSPPKALITQGLARTFARSMPRSPAGRRRSWLIRGAQRHPFIPLNDSDLLSAPKTAGVNPVSRKLTMSQPREAPVPPTTAPLLAPHSPPKPPKRVPPPLVLEEAFERRVRFGLPSSPRFGLPGSPRPATARTVTPRTAKRGESPAF